MYQKYFFQTNMYFNIYVGTGLVTQFLFTEGFQYATFIMERIGKEIIENNYFTTLIQLLCLQSSEWSIEGTETIKDFIEYVKQKIFFKYTFPYGVSSRYMNFFYRTLFDHLNLAKTHNLAFHIKSATNIDSLSTNYCCYLGIPKMNGCKIVDYIKLSNPIAEIHFSDFF